MFDSYYRERHIMMDQFHLMLLYGILLPRQTCFNTAADSLIEVISVTINKAYVI